MSPLNLDLRMGTDLIGVEEIVASIDTFGDRYLTRVFTSGELESCERGPGSAPREQRLAARFAAKEAVIKALRPTAGVDLTDIEVCNDEFGAPNVVLGGSMARLAEELRVVSSSISLSHTAEYATASYVAVLDTSPQIPRPSGPDQRVPR